MMHPIDIVPKEDNEHTTSSGGSAWWALIALVVIVALVVVATIAVSDGETPTPPQDPAPTEAPVNPGP